MGTQKWTFTHQHRKKHSYCIKLYLLAFLICIIIKVIGCLVRCYGAVKKIYSPQMKHGCSWSWLGFIFCVSICTAQLSFNPTGQPNDVVVTSSSYVYVSTNVSGSGRVYRLNGSLVQQEVLQFPSGIAVLRIALSSDQSKLIVCVSNGSCIAYNADDLNKGSVRTFQNVQAATNNNVALVSAQVSGGGNSFYVGSSNGTVILIGQYGLDGTAGNVSRTSGNLFSVTASPFTRNWYGGFVAGSYTYFVVFDVFPPGPSPGPGVRVLRVCNNEASIAAMYELYLNCIVDGFEFINARITGASLVSYTNSSGGLYEDRLVVEIVTPPSALGGAPYYSRVCTYSLATINSKMDSTPCFSNLPWRNPTLSWSCSAPCNISSPGATGGSLLDQTSLTAIVFASNAAYDPSYSLSFNTENLTLLFLASTNLRGHLGNSTVQAVSECLLTIPM